MAMAETVVEMEKLLAQENDPESPKRQAGEAPPQDQQHPRGYELGNLLRSAKALVKNQNQANADAESFIKYAKAKSLVFATTAIGLNIFGASLALHLGKYLHVRPFMAAMSLSFLPLTLLTAGMALSLKPRSNHNALINLVAVLLILETLYMAVMCTLFGYYMIPGAAFSILLAVTCFAAAVLITLPSTMYNRLGYWGCGDVALS